MIGIKIIEAGLGNKLFQMVFAYAYAKTRAVAFRFENELCTSHHTSNRYEWLVDRFKAQPNYHVNGVNGATYTHEYTEPSEWFCSYNDLNFGSMGIDNVLCHGYFQNEKYFDAYSDEIRTILREPSFVTNILLSEHLNEIYAALPQSMFMHFRLGDYINCGKHFVDLTSYYLKCLSAVDPSVVVMVFSNDPTNIKAFYPTVWQTLMSLPNKVLIVEESDEVVNLYLMARCRLGGICSNSTFCWWGAWLNADASKRVYMPDKWMNVGWRINIQPANVIQVSVT